MLQSKGSHSMQQNVLELRMQDLNGKVKGLPYEQSKISLVKFKNVLISDHIIGKNKVNTFKIEVHKSD